MLGISLPFPQATPMLEGLLRSIAAVFIWAYVAGLLIAAYHWSQE